MLKSNNFSACAPIKARCQLPSALSVNTFNRELNNAEIAFSYHPNTKSCEPFIFVPNDKASITKSWANKFTSLEECESRK